MAKRLNYGEIKRAVSERAPFIGNSMWSDYVDTRRALSVGALPEHDARFLEADRQEAYDRMEALYVVWSYRTPIAWAYGNVVRIPEVRYSVTTSKQQSIVRGYLR